MWLPPFSRTSLLSLPVLFIDCSVNIGLNLPLSVITYRSSSSLAVSWRWSLASQAHPTHTHQQNVSVFIIYKKKKKAKIFHRILGITLKKNKSKKKIQTKKNRYNFLIFVPFLICYDDIALWNDGNWVSLESDLDEMYVQKKACKSDPLDFSQKLGMHRQQAESRGEAADAKG